jgi:hypothetical protein
MALQQLRSRQEYHRHCQRCPTSYPLADPVRPNTPSTDASKFHIGISPTPTQRTISLNRIRNEIRFYHPATNHRRRILRRDLRSRGQYTTRALRILFGRLFHIRPRDRGGVVHPRPRPELLERLRRNPPTKRGARGLQCRHRRQRLHRLGGRLLGFRRVFASLDHRDIMVRLAR